jgi:hypothetical protein
MRPHRILILAATLVACHRTTEVHGLYVNQDGKGSFFPCDDPKIVVAVQDSALEAQYHRTATSPYQAVFVRLRGVNGHAGSIYGGQRIFEVQQVLEVRSRATGECPRVAQPAPLPKS